MNPMLDAWRRELLTPLNTLQGELNRLLRTYGVPPGATEPGAGREPAGWVPDLDVYETPSEIGLWVDVPGVDPASIDVSLTGRTLEVRGVKPAEERPSDAREFTSERPRGRFERQIELNEDVDFDQTQAKVRNGVLHIRLPKAASIRPRTIPVQSSEA